MIFLVALFTVRPLQLGGSGVRLSSPSGSVTAKWVLMYFYLSHCYSIAQHGTAHILSWLIDKKN